MLKVYKMDGKTEAHEVFTSPSGKTKVKVTFSKGNLDPKNRVPARCITDNEAVQAVIENSPKFGRTIFLEKVYGSPAHAEAPVAPAPAPATPKKGSKAKAPALKVMEEVKTIADAATVLVAEGVSAADIDGTIEGAVKLAKSFGISFPNLQE